jgi:hypothetical protein
MVRCSRRHTDGANVGLAVYVGVCCGITVCLTLGFYWLMQPTRMVNPGLAAYKPPPGTAMNLVGLMPPPAPELIAVSIEPLAETSDTSASQRETNQRPQRQNRSVRSGSSGRRT